MTHVATTRQKPSRTRHVSGMTLVEIMIVLVVLAVLVVAFDATLGIYSPRGTREDLHKATAQLEDQMIFALTSASAPGDVPVAYEIQIADDQDPQRVRVLRHDTRNCREDAGTLVRDIAFTSPTGNAGALFPGVSITSRSHDVGTLPGLCFRPGGAVEHPQGGLIPPVAESDFAAGEFAVGLRLTGSGAAAAHKHTVIVTHNGKIRTQYEIP